MTPEQVPDLDAILDVTDIDETYAGSRKHLNDTRALVRECRGLRTRLAAAERDTVRLDWLSEGREFRKDIDAAILSAKEPGK